MTTGAVVYPRVLLFPHTRNAPKKWPRPDGAAVGAFLREVSAENGPAQSYRNTLGLGGCSFQFGRTSILWPRLPHLAHFTRERNAGTSVSAG